MSFIDELTAAPRTVSLDVYAAPSLKPRPRNAFLAGKSKHIAFKTIVRPTKKKVAVNNVNQHIAELATNERAAFVASMGANLSDMRSFVLKEIAPKMLPAVSAFEEVSDILTELTGTQINTPLYAKALKMLNAAADVKLATWVSKYLGLTAAERKIFLTLLLGSSHDRPNVPKVPEVQPLQGQEKTDTRAQLRQLLEEKAQQLGARPRGAATSRPGSRR